eukprot:gene11647-13062_t
MSEKSGGRWPWRLGRLEVLRILVTLSLLAAAGVVGYLTYHFLYASQHSLQTEQYDAVAKKIDDTTTKGIRDKFNALINIASTTALLFPNASSWPYNAIPLTNFVAMTSPLMRMAQVRAAVLSPLVTPEQVQPFEDFAYDWLNKSGRPDLGISWFGKGIYALNETTHKRYHDTKGSSLGAHRLLAPVIEAGNLTKNAGSFMYNFYSEIHRIQAVDASIACVQEMSSPLEALQQCASFSDVVTLVGDWPVFNPAAVLTQPVVMDSKDVVAIVFVAFNWINEFNRAVNDEVTGLHIVLRFAQEEVSYTFLIDRGVVSFVGFGDRHDSTHNSRRYSFSLSLCNGLTVYYVEIYPSDDWVAVYENDLPAIVCGVVVGIIIFTSSVFLLYDYLINRAAKEQEVVLETKRQFVRYISHEIRTPLNIVQLGFKLLYSEMFAFRAAHFCNATKVIDGLPPPAQQRVREGVKAKGDEVEKESGLKSTFDDWLGLVTDIADSSDVAISVLNDLINYDKLHMGTLQLEIEPLAVWDLLGPAVHPFIIQARHAGVSLNIDLGSKDEELFIFGDLSKLSQVVRNLISNALKFTPSGGEVRVKAVHNAEGLPRWLDVDSGFVRAGSLLVTVTDTGAGISQENLRRLFQEGVQFHANQLQGGQGSGLGLWIAKSIVELHHGTLSAESEGEQKGSTFLLELPVARRENSTKSQCDDTVEKSSSDVALLGDSSASLLARMSSVGAQAELGRSIRSASRPLNILITDDSALNRKMVCRLLRTAGYTCFEAADGQECVDKALQAAEGLHEPIDLILMDYEMPRMNGPVACNVLRSLGSTVPIIGITGNVLAEDKTFFQRAGALRVLTKPFTLAQLGDCLADLDFV